MEKRRWNLSLKIRLKNETKKTLKKTKKCIDKTKNIINMIKNPKNTRSLTI